MRIIILRGKEITGRENFQFLKITIRGQGHTHHHTMDDSEGSFSLKENHLLKAHAWSMPQLHTVNMLDKTCMHWAIPVKSHIYIILSTIPVW